LRVGLSLEAEARASGGTRSAADLPNRLLAEHPGTWKHSQLGGSLRPLKIWLPDDLGAKTADRSQDFAILASYLHSRGRKPVLSDNCGAQSSIGQ